MISFAPRLFSTRNVDKIDPEPVKSSSTTKPHAAFKPRAAFTLIGHLSVTRGDSANNNSHHPTTMLLYFTSLLRHTADLSRSFHTLMKAFNNNHGRKTVRKYLFTANVQVKTSCELPAFVSHVAYFIIAEMIFHSFETRHIFKSPTRYCTYTFFIVSLVILEGDGIYLTNLLRNVNVNDGFDV